MVRHAPGRIPSPPGLILLLVLAAAGYASAQENRYDPFAGDTRLEQKVTVSAEGQSLGEFLELLAGRTGVALTASRQTADDKVVIFGPSRPLREILTDLATLFDHRWTRERDAEGSRRYTLARTARAPAHEQRLARAAAEKVMSQVDEQVRALGETPEQLARRPQQDPIRRFLSDPELRFPTELYAELTPEQRIALYLRRKLDFPFRSLPERYQTPLRKVYAERLGIFERYVRENPGVLPPMGKDADDSRRLFVDRPEDLDKGSLRFRVRRGGGHLFIGMGLGVLPFRADVDRDPSGKRQYITSLGFWGVTILEGPASWVLPPHGNPYTLEKVSEEAPLPEAAITRGVLREKTWLDRLRNLAKTSGRPIVADYYRSKPVAQPPDEPELSGDETTRVLDTLCRPEGYLWWTHERTLFFRKREWYEQKRYEVPDRWLAAVAKRLRAGGGHPRLADVLLAAQLTPAQLAGLTSLYEGEFSGDEETYAGLPELLAIFKAGWVRDIVLPLGAPAPGGIPAPQLGFPDLSLRQRNLLAAFLETRDFPVTPEGAQTFRVAISRAPETGSDGDPPRVLVRLKWSLGMEEGMPYGLSLPLQFQAPGTATRIDLQ